jgi:cell division protein FtsQ
MKSYAELVRDLDSGGAHYSQDLSEVDLSDLEDLKVRVNDPAGDVLVHLGSSDFLRRFKIYVSHAQGWRQQFDKLESVNLRYDNQVIVNPDMEGKARPAALSAARAAAAVGVKPAALITRLPNDRAIPKPAFELTEKKLDPKAQGAGKKAEPKPKVVKTAVKKSMSGVKTDAAKKPTRKASRAALSKAAKKSPAKSGGQKPSPAVAKKQADYVPSD